MQRWFLSYHAPDQALAERLKAAIERKDAASEVFFAPTNLRAGGSWSAQLAEKIEQSTAFILLVGASGIGKWQVPEYDEALDKWVRSPAEFTLIMMLLEGQTAPGLPFLRQLHWIVSPDPTSDKAVARLFEAASGGGGNPRELWRYTSPYRGLEAMEEKDSDYFFGRKRETVDVLSALAGATDRLAILIGNSGVGKSSLAQAGVLAALKRQAWPEDAAAAPTWPADVPQQPPMVLSVAAAGNATAQRAGRLFPRHLAVCRDRPRAGEASAWLARSARQRSGGLARSDRRHRAPPRGARSTGAAGIFPLCRSGRRALRARRGVAAPAVFRADCRQPVAQAAARDDEPALRFSRPSAERRGAVRRPPTDRRAAAA